MKKIFLAALFGAAVFLTGGKRADDTSIAPACTMSEVADEERTIRAFLAGFEASTAISTETVEKTEETSVKAAETSAKSEEVSAETSAKSEEVSVETSVKQETTSAETSAKSEEVPAQTSVKPAQTSAETSATPADTSAAETTSAAASEKNSVLIWPVPGYTYISSYFGIRNDPFDGEETSHNGIDIPAPAGTPVAAAGSGTVLWSTYSSTAGNWVGIDHGDGLVTVYMHMSALAVSAGTTVKAGETVGFVGTTGSSTAEHLHFAVKVNSVYADPLGYFG